MALPLLRFCNCNRPFTVLVRFFTSRSLLLYQSRRLAPVASVVCDVRRRYSSEGGRHKNQKVMVVGIPNPFIWFRTRIYFFLIRTYFDKEFNIEEFTDGAKQVCKPGNTLFSCGKQLYNNVYKNFCHIRRCLLCLCKITIVNNVS